MRTEVITYIQRKEEHLFLNYDRQSKSQLAHVRNSPLLLLVRIPPREPMCSFRLAPLPEQVVYRVERRAGGGSKPGRAEVKMRRRARLLVWREHLEVQDGRAQRPVVNLPRHAVPRAPAALLFHLFRHQLTLLLLLVHHDYLVLVRGPPAYLLSPALPALSRLVCPACPERPHTR